jgi:ferredoxin
MATERKALPVIDPMRCTGCGWCVGACPPRVLSLVAVPNWQKMSSLHDVTGCTGCAKCAMKCPFDAIAMERAGGPR